MFVAIKNRDRKGLGAASGTGEAENRGYTRFPLNAPAVIQQESTIIAGQLVNMSLTGAFIGTASRIPVHQGVTVTVLQGAKSDLLNDMEATVTRITERGLAVRFDKVLLESRGARRAS
jgi:hypothetical protein